MFKEGVGTIVHLFSTKSMFYIAKKEAKTVTHRSLESILSEFSGILYKDEGF